MASSEQSNEPKHRHMIQTVDIGILYGIRLLICIGVVLMHTYGMAFLWQLPSGILPLRDPPPTPWTSIDAFYNSLIGSSFVWLFHGVNIFWFISGFLISYQLYFIPPSSYPQFLLNRLLRLYPLLIPLILFMYICGVPGCSSLWHIVRALLFLDNFWDTGLDSTCSSVAWSLSLDMHTCIILIILFYIFDPKKHAQSIVYILWIIFIASCITSIYMFHVHCLKYLKFGDDSSLIVNGIDIYYPESMRIAQSDDVYKHIDKNIYDPDNLTDDQIRNQRLYNNDLSSLYCPSYTQIGAGLFGAITCLDLLSQKNVNNPRSKYVTLFIFVISNYCLTTLYFMTSIWKESHIVFFEFKDSIITSIVFGLNWKIATLSVFCGMNILLRMNNKYVNGILNNRITRFLCKYTYGVFLVHTLVIAAFVCNDEYRKGLSSIMASDSSDKEYNGSQFVSIFGKSLGVSFVLAMVLYHIVEYPVIVWRKQYILRFYEKQKLQ